MFEERETLMGTLLIVKTLEDGSVWYVPEDPMNADYREYLAWKAGDSGSIGS